MPKAADAAKSVVQPVKSSATVKAPPTAPQLLSRLQLAYKRMSALRLQGTSETSVTADGKLLAKPKRQIASLMFRRPNRILIDMGGGRLIADGKSVYDYRLAAKQYMKLPLNEDFLRRLAGSKPEVGVLGLLFGTDYRKVIVSPKLLPDEKIGSHQVYVLTFALRPGAGAPKGVKGKQTLWISKEDLGIYRSQVTLTVDTRVLSRNAPKGPNGKVARVIQTTTTTDLNLFQPNVRLSNAVFRFVPPSGVKQFRQPNLMGLINKPAPDFSYRAADDSTRKLSDLKGKFVLLNFWGLPMCDSQLPVLQSLSKSIRPDTELIAINLNGDKAAVADYLAKKGSTFPVVYADQQIARVAGEKYNIRVLPTMLIVDPKGIIRAQFLGLATQKQIEDRLNSLR